VRKDPVCSCLSTWYLLLLSLNPSQTYLPSHDKPIRATEASLDLWAAANPCWLVFQEAATTPELVLVSPCQHWELHEIPPCDCAHHKPAFHRSVQLWKIYLHPLADRVVIASDYLGWWTRVSWSRGTPTHF